MMAVLMIASMAMAQKTIHTPLTKEMAKKAAAMKGTHFSLKSHQAANFTAPKAIISTFPYVEDFETPNTNWTLTDNDNDGFNWSLLSTLGGNMDCHSGVECMVSASYDNDNMAALTPDNWMISSGFQIPATATDFMLSWYDAAQDPDYPAESYSVYIATTNTVAAFTATTAVFTTTLTSDNWTKRSVNLSAYAGQTIYVAFRHHNCSDMFFLKIDDVRIGGPEAPMVAIHAPLTAETGTTVDLSASVSDANNVDWILNGATPATATGLDIQASWATAGTYQIIASATNAVGTAYDTATIEIYHCDAISEFPFTADFSNGLGCWNSRPAIEDNPGWMQCAEAGLEGVNGLLSMSAQSFMGIITIDMPHDNWLISPEIEMPANSNYELAWNVMEYDPNYANDHYTVYVIAGTDTTQIYSETLNSSYSDWTTRIAGLGAYAGQTIRIAFRHHESVGGYVLMLDQISIRDLSAPIVSVHGPASAIAGNAVTFTAVSGNADTYAWSIDGNDANCTTATLTTTFTAAGTHTISVVATNTVGSNSASTTISVRECNNITAFPYTEGFDEGDLGCWNTVDADGDGHNWDNALFGVSDENGGFYGHNNSEGCAISASYINGVGALTPDNWLISPAIELPADQALYLVWYVRALDANYPNDTYSVYAATSNTPEAFAATTPLFTETLSSINYSDRHVALSQFAGQTIYVAFRHHNSEDVYQMLLDDISITSTVGINGVESAVVNAYPNPTSSMLNIQAEGLKEVSLLDLNGRVLMTQSQSTLDMSKLANGIYFIRVITENGTATQKVVKR